jgi:hypothetical protein
MDPRLPLFSPLSQALVAFILEFGNEFEKRVPRRTAGASGSGNAPHPGAHVEALFRW